MEGVWCMKILVVDDSRTARMLIKSILSEYNSRVELSEAENGREAVDAVKREQPDLIFLDLTMPVLDGYEALKIIKADFPSMTVIVLTADIQEKSVARCMAAGAYMVMKKLPQKEKVFEVLDKIAGTAGA